MKEKVEHPPLTPPIKGGKVPPPFVGEGLGEWYFRIKYYGAFGQRYENSLLNEGQAKSFSWKCARGRMII